MKSHLLSGLLLAAFSTAATARNVPLVDANPVPVPEGTSAEQVADAIVRTLADQDWEVAAQAPGQIDATLQARGRTVRIHVTYDARDVRFLYQDSTKLEYELKDGRAHIQPLYMAWINDLVVILNEKLHPGAGETLVVVGAEPPTRSSARPIVRVATPEELTQKFSLIGWNMKADVYQIRDAAGRQRHGTRVQHVAVDGQGDAVGDAGAHGVRQIARSVGQRLTGQLLADVLAEETDPVVVKEAEGHFTVLVAKDAHLDVLAIEEGEAGFLRIVLDADAGRGLDIVVNGVDPARLLVQDVPAAMGHCGLDGLADAGGLGTGGQVDQPDADRPDDIQDPDRLVGNAQASGRPR